MFCVGLELYNAETPVKEYLLYMLMYAFMSPVGIGIGTVIDVGVEHHHGTSYHATVGILQVITNIFDNHSFKKLRKYIFQVKSSTLVNSFSISGFCWWHASVFSSV